MPNADPAQSHVAKTLAHTSPMISCRFDPSGRFVFAGAEDNRVWRWEIESGGKVELAGHDSWVRSLGFSTSGEVLVTGGYDGRLVWWQAFADKPTPTRTVEAHQGWIRALSVSPDGQWIATCGNDKLVKIWQMSDGALVRELPGHESHVYNVAFHPNGKDLVSGDLKSQYIHWDATTGEVKRKFAIPALHKYDAGFLADIGGAHSMAFSRDGKTIFFTRNNMHKGVQKADSTGRVRMKIYTARLGKYDWENAQELPFNNDNYTCMHPSLNVDGTKLYFTSDMPGGYGGLDLYVSERTADGWGTPVNLGPEINTDKNEVFPFITVGGKTLFQPIVREPITGGAGQVPVANPEDGRTLAARLSDGSACRGCR